MLAPNFIILAHAHTLTPAGPRLHFGYPENVISGLTLHAHTKSLTDLVGVGGLLLDSL